jgi:hypothetical protein
MRNVETTDWHAIDEASSSGSGGFLLAVVPASAGLSARASN